MGVAVLLIYKPECSVFLAGSPEAIVCMVSAFRDQLCQHRAEALYLLCTQFLSFN